MKGRGRGTEWRLKNQALPLSASRRGPTNSSSFWVTSASDKLPQAIQDELLVLKKSQALPAFVPWTAAVNGLMKVGTPLCYVHCVLGAGHIVLLQR